ncbi:MAG TPA: hypothetical protein H9720_05885 [Candidatus Limosilactobacillus intestinigallinarum]|nr:hypothetical protein [Candidatus Limosilactobacillus intestinigallinarum]
MLVEKLQTLSLRVQDEGQSFVILVKRDAPVNVTVQFSAFNIKLSGKVYRLNFKISNEHTETVFQNTYNLNTENSSFVTKNIIDGYGSSGYQFSFETVLKAGQTYKATLGLIDNDDNELSKVEVFFNTKGD